MLELDLHKLLAKQGKKSPYSNIIICFLLQIRYTHKILRFMNFGCIGLSFPLFKNKDEISVVKLQPVLFLILIFETPRL